MIVAGFGFRAAASVESLRDALASSGVTPQALAAPDDKADEASIKALAAELRVSVLAISPERIRAQITHTRSHRILVARSTGSVAEAAALAGAQPGARLTQHRVISPDRMATCAIAEGGYE